MTDTTLLSSLLRSTLLFADLDDSALERIATDATERTLQRGDVLFVEGEEPDDLYVVIEGRIAIANRSIDGRRRRCADGARRPVRRDGFVRRVRSLC